MSKKTQNDDDQRLKEAVGRIKNKIVVLSGKGGVGKSTVSVNVALALSLEGKRVGLLDVDVHGPSIPRLLGLSEQHGLHKSEDGYILPIEYNPNLLVMSLGFMLPDRNSSVIWRGPMKMKLMKQFLEDVSWGQLDYLVVDCPPGTGDEPLSAVQLLGKDAMALIVTTPQVLAIDDVRRSVNFCHQTGNKILGMIENMSGFICPYCRNHVDIFTAGGGRDLAQDTGVNFLGCVPLDPEIVKAGDRGYAYMQEHPESESAKAMKSIIEPILNLQSDKV